MKKTYTKPEIMFESFSFSTSIAGTCQVKTNTPNYGNCAYGVTDTSLCLTWNVFTSDYNFCTTSEAQDGAADGLYDGVCYHAPYGNNLFNS